MCTFVTNEHRIRFVADDDFVDDDYAAGKGERFTDIWFKKMRDVTPMCVKNTVERS